MDTEKWGRTTARERYGSEGMKKVDVGQPISAKPSPSDAGGNMGKNAIIGLVNQPEVNEISRPMQAPQAVNDQHLPGYDNDVPSNWLRGMGPGEATGNPGFDKKRSG